MNIHWTRESVDAMPWSFSHRLGFPVSWSSNCGFVALAEGVKQSGFATVLPVDGREIETSVRQKIKGGKA